MKLSDKDGRIVDLLLDNPPADPSVAGVFVKSENLQPKRIQTIQKVLGVLDAYPADDPPADLASRTLKRIDAAAKTGEVHSSPPPAAKVENRPPLS